MITVRQISAALAGMVLLAAGPAAAEEKKLSLRDALLAALQGNTLVRAGAQSLSASGQDIEIARSFLLPKIAVEERFMRTDNPTYAFMGKLNQGRFRDSDFAIAALNNPAPVSDYQTSISFEQALYAPKAHIGLSMARTEHEAKKHEQERRREETVFSVFRTYLEVQTAASYLSAADKGIEDAAEHLRIAGSRQQAGLGLHSDKLRAEAALRAAEERRIAAEKNMLLARRALGLLLGLSESVLVEEQRPELAMKEITYYSDRAGRRNDLLALEQRRSNAENGLKIARASFLPVAGLGGAWQRNSHKAPFGEEGSSWQVAAFLRWEFFDGMKRQAEQKKAESGLAEAAEYLEGMKKRIAFEIYEAYLNVDEARKGLELAKAGLSVAEEGRRLVRLRYENSLAAVVDLFDAQMSLDAARADLVAREASYQLSIARLSYQSGAILNDLNIE